MKMKFFSILIIFSLLIFCIMGNVEADETKKIICEVESPVDGVSGNFGFTMTYNPGEATILEDTTLDLSYSPSPEDATIIVNLEQWLEGKDLPFNIPPGFEEFELPIDDTPLGTYSIVSEVIYDAGIAQLVLDVEIKSQINTTLDNTGGLLSETYFEWHDWGAKEIVLTPLATDTYIEVSADFIYYVNLDFMVTLNHWKLYATQPRIRQSSTILFNKIIPLKEMPFPDTITSKITIDKSHTKIKELEAELTAANMEIDGLEADLIKANADISVLESNLTKSNSDINGLNSIVRDLKAENKNLTHDLKDSTEFVLDLSEIIEEIDEEPDYSLAFVGLGVCIGSILWFFIVFMVLRKKKKKAEPQLHRAPLSEELSRPQYDDNRQTSRYDKHYPLQSQHDKYQRPRPRYDDYHHPQSHYNEYQRPRLRHDDFQKPRSRYGEYRQSRPRHNDYQKPPRCRNCRQQLRFVKEYESWYCDPCDSYPFDD